MGWFITYIIVGVIILILGFVIMCASMEEIVSSHDNDKEPIVALRVVSLFTAGSWAVAILWPLLLMAALPVLCIYGTWTALRATKNKSLVYGKKDNVEA